METNLKLECEMLPERLHTLLFCCSSLHCRCCHLPTEVPTDGNTSRGGLLRGEEEDWVRLAKLFVSLSLSVLQAESLSSLFSHTSFMICLL
jgi:hypothetical protein